MFTLGIPNKGRLHGLAKYVVQQMGLLPTDSQLRHKLNFETADGKTQIALLSGEDIPTYVALDALQLGVVGSDYVVESAPGQLVHICNLGWCAGDLCLMARANDPIATRHDLRPGDRIYSQYPNTTVDLILQSKLEGVDFVPVHGAAETFFDLRSDCRATIDIVATGNSMRANNLKIVERLAPTSACLFSNAESQLQPFVTNFAYRFRDVAATVSEETLEHVVRANAGTSANPVAGKHPKREGVSARSS